MKNLFLTIVTVFLTTNLSLAQNSIAYIDGSKKSVEAETSITIEFKVDNIASETVLNKMVEMFSISKGVYKIVSYSLKDNMGYFTIALLKNNFCENCQNLFLAAKIESIYTSGIEGYDVIKTSDVETICKEIVGRQPVAPIR